jgi:hypothetical protein
VKTFSQRRPRDAAPRVNEVTSDPVKVREQLVRAGVLRPIQSRPTLRLLGVRHGALSEDPSLPGWKYDENEGFVEWEPPRPQRDGRGVEFR